MFFLSSCPARFVVPPSEGREKIWSLPKLGLPNGKTFDEFNLKIKLEKRTLKKLGLWLLLVRRGDDYDLEGCFCGAGGISFFFFLDIVCVQFVKIYPVVCLQYGYYSACLLYFDNK